MSSKLLVYGATGFVGGHIARTAAGSGLPTILAGRDPAKLDPLAAELGAERRAFGLADPGAIETALKGVTVVLNCAGPFKRTAEPLAGACSAQAFPISTSPAKSRSSRRFTPRTPKRRPVASCCFPASASTSLRPIAWRCTSSGGCRRRPA